MLQRKKTIFEEFSVAFAKTSVTEKCRELARILPFASPNELHVVFTQICGEVFGYGAGGVGFGWDLPNMSRTGNHNAYMGLGGGSQSYGSFHAALSFLGSRGPLFEAIHKLMNDSSHLYEFPVSQLPSQKSMAMASTGGGTVALTAFEYYFYHFANLMVRRQKQNIAPTNVNVNASSETLYLLLLEDYLSCFLPVDQSMQAKLFTQPFQATSASPQPQHSPLSSPTSGPVQTRPSLFKKNFNAARFKSEETRHDGLSSLNKESAVKSTSSSSETWRSDTLVRTLILFWIEGYSASDNGSPNHSPGGGVSTSSKPSSMEYFSASLKVASSLPSAELMRVVRMFIKHSHYFANACQQGSVYIPASLKVDVFSSRANKGLLFSFLAQAVDHWPYDASFRLVLETWLSYIQPWRYLSIMANEDDNGAASKMDPARFSPFVADNFIFYSKLMAKVLRRFQRLDIGSPKTAFMLFRVLKVMSQDNLFACLRSCANSQGYLVQSEDAKNEHIFSAEFKSFVSELLVTSLNILESEKHRMKEKTGAAMLAQKKEEQPTGIVSLFNAVVDFVNGGPSSESTDAAEKTEQEKVIQHLTFVTEKLALLFDLGQVLSDFRLLPSENSKNNMENIESVDQTDASSYGLSPAQRRGILTRKIKVRSKYLGHPDLVPIRSDEVTFLVRFLHQLSEWINGRFGASIEETYHRSDLIGSVFREIAFPPTTYLAKVDQLDNSFRGGMMSRQPVKLPARLNLRTLGSYIAVAYAIFYMFFMTFIMGYSYVASLLLLVFLSLLFFTGKSFVSPFAIPPDNQYASHLSESF